MEGLEYEVGSGRKVIRLEGKREERNCKWEGEIGGRVGGSEIGDCKEGGKRAEIQYEDETVCASMCRNKGKEREEYGGERRERR